MNFIHELNLWLTYEMGSEAVLTPLYTGLILLTLALGLSHFLREEGPSLFDSPRGKLIVGTLALSLLGLFAAYSLSIRMDDRLAVAEKMRIIRERGGATYSQSSLLTPAMGVLTEKFAWACAMEKDPWSCVKGRGYLAKFKPLVH